MRINLPVEITLDRLGLGLSLGRRHPLSSPDCGACYHTRYGYIVALPFGFEMFVLKKEWYAPLDACCIDGLEAREDRVLEEAEEIKHARERRFLKPAMDRQADPDLIARIRHLYED